MADDTYENDDPAPLETEAEQIGVTPRTSAPPRRTRRRGEDVLVDVIEDPMHRRRGWTTRARRMPRRSRPQPTPSRRPEPGGPLSPEPEPHAPEPRSAEPEAPQRCRSPSR